MCTVRVCEVIVLLTRVITSLPAVEEGERLINHLVTVILEYFSILGILARAFPFFIPGVLKTWLQV